MKPDRDRNPESRKSVRFARAAVPLTTILLLAGCSSAPDWADPTEWFGSDSADKNAESANAKTPGEDKKFPNLSSVPERPKPPSEEERKRLADSLTADRENAQYSKEVIRRQSAASVPPPPPPPPAANSAPTRSAVAVAPAVPARAVPRAPAPVAPAAPARRAASAGSTLPPTPISRQPQFAAPPASPVAPVAAVNSVAPLSVRPSPNARSVARIGNPSFGAPPSDIAAAQGAAAAPRFAAAPTPRVAGTFSNGVTAAAGAPAALVRFKAGSASLTRSARSQVRQIAGMYRQRGGAVRVEGHASSRTRNMDPVQHHLVNFNVSLNRANAVAEELVRQGVPAGAVFVAAMSDSQPLYYEVMPAGDAGNQRVEIRFVN